MVDWAKTVAWTAAVALCVGFWVGVIFTLAEVH